MVLLMAERTTLSLPVLSCAFRAANKDWHHSCPHFNNLWLDEQLMAAAAGLKASAVISAFFP